ncbi:MAG: hypothetical protein IJP62_01975 [Treponema sp.]|nr:hypothetical protein [Treponema sp.]
MINRQNKEGEVSPSLQPSASLRSSATPSAGTPPQRPASFVASPQCAALYFQYRKHPQSTNTNISFGFRAHKLDIARLESALNQIIARHEQLRSNFTEENGVVMQTIAPHRRLTVTRFVGNDFRKFNQPFCLEQDLLMRAAVKGDTVLLSFSHIITDGLSMAIFFRELNELYEAPLTSACEQSPLATAPHIVDCRIENEIFSANEPYWLHVTENAPSPLMLPSDLLANDAARSYGGAGGSLIATFGAETTAAVRAMCRRLAITPFVFYITAFCVFLARTCHATDVITGTNIACRTKANLRAIGLFATVVPVRLHVPAAWTNAPCAQSPSAASPCAMPSADARDALLLEMHRHIRASLCHKHVDMASVLARKGLSDWRDLFRTLFTYEDARMANIRLGGEPCEFVPVPSSHAAADFNICLFPFKTESRLLLIYRTDLFSAKTAAAYLDEYMDIVAEMAQ